jgi:hypothetical protein
MTTWGLLRGVSFFCEIRILNVQKFRAFENFEKCGAIHKVVFWLFVGRI